MTNNEKKMIDPANVRTLLEAWDGSDQSHSDHRNLVNGLRNLLPRDYPEDMLGMWAEHPEYGWVLVSRTKPDDDGEVTIIWNDGATDRMRNVYVSELTFPEQPPERLVTLEDYENAPVGTVVAVDGNPAWTKVEPDKWQTLGGVARDYDIACGIDKVLRWGWIQ